MPPKQASTRIGVTTRASNKLVHPGATSQPRPRKTPAQAAAERQAKAAAEIAVQVKRQDNVDRVAAFEDQMADDDSVRDAEAARPVVKAMVKTLRPTRTTQSAAPAGVDGEKNEEVASVGQDDEGSDFDVGPDSDESKSDTPSPTIGDDEIEVDELESDLEEIPKSKQKKVKPPKNALRQAVGTQRAIAADTGTPAGKRKGGSVIDTWVPVSKRHKAVRASGLVAGFEPATRSQGGSQSANPTASGVEEQVIDNSLYGGYRDEVGDEHSKSKSAGMPTGQKKLFLNPVTVNHKSTEKFTTSKTIQKATKASGKAPTNSLLPPGVLDRWDQFFLPIWKDYVGTLENPWTVSSPEVNVVPQMQAIWNEAIPGVAHVFEKGDDIYRVNEAELLGLHDVRSATMSDIGDLGPKPSPESEIEAESPSLDLTLTRDPDQKEF
ncbi:hypothetical protein BV25DRAFT_1903862 [Artomyces pyxidatus]|uniref:Uncharacterized protein n=1 Tax=Artomyces pyxidatus TaxID=48021 RepID=A0ACB8SEQ7_9AGAM|nr:hypothetical protein BV25DRAFT_1903862 [Artomyces pyxidatus]